MFRLDDVYAGGYCCKSNLVFYLGIIAYYLGYETQSNPNILSNKNRYLPWDVKIAEHGYSADEISNGFNIINFKPDV